MDTVVSTTDRKQLIFIEKENNKKIRICKILKLKQINASYVEFMIQK